MNVVIIGSGNVATVLSGIIKAAGHHIIQVFSRQLQHAAQLGAALECDFTDDYGKLVKDADIYFIAIADAALKELHQDLHLGEKLVIHTAGAMSKDVLMEVSSKYGVIYPLQSLRREVAQLAADIPLLIDGDSQDSITLIERFALSISSSVVRASDEERLKLHIAAVFVSNFTNHLYALADKFCKANHVSFQYLQPLIEETATRLRTNAPADMQTGPAARRDNITLDKHLRELAAYPKLRSVYLKLSDSIMYG